MVRQCATRDSGKNILGLFCPAVHLTFRQAGYAAQFFGTIIELIEFTTDYISMNRSLFGID
jgi:hypothetical protein